jgi:hypothetical protein
MIFSNLKSLKSKLKTLIKRRLFFASLLFTKVLKFFLPHSSLSQTLVVDLRAQRRRQLTKLIDRDFIRAKGNQAERQFYHHLARGLKQEIFEERQKLGQEYIAKYLDRLIDPRFTIDPTQGIAVTCLKGYPLFEAALAEAHVKIAEKEAGELLSKGSLDFIASSKKDFDSNAAISKLALDPNLIIPITRYFGYLPTLFGFDINRASCKEIVKGSSHLYHRDPEDITQIKVFIYLNDVKECCGPFTAIPADRSNVVAEYFNYTVGRLEDEKISRVIANQEEKVCLGERGTLVFCDTNRCFHYGGRIKEGTRYVLTIYYSLPTSTWFPLFPGDGERRNLIPFMRPVEDSNFEKVILGYDLV